MWQNCVLFVASYFFYGYADIKMLPLLGGVTVVYYFLGLLIQKYKNTKGANWLMACGIIFGIGLLFYFKYANFFISSFVDLFRAFGMHCNEHTFNIVVPLGISYFVFRMLSYLIEIHRGGIIPTRNFILFATFVAFFPCMLSGPIDRPNTFLPQLAKARPFDARIATDGLRQILWGMFKKMAVADTLAVFVDEYLSVEMIANVRGSTMFFVIIAYTFQIYADFSGYSDMAIGVGKLLNVKITKNFNYPFFSLNIADFWRRWHMSLTNWMTDYVYLPLSFILRGWRKVGIIIAIIINFIIVGIWHGANWNYVLYGFYHGLLFIPLLFFRTMNSSKEVDVNRLNLPRIKDFGCMLLTFLFVAFGMIIFRSNNIDIFLQVIHSFGNDPISMPEFGSKTAWLMTICMLLTEWIMRKREYGLDLSSVNSRFLRWSCYLLLIFSIFALGGGEQHYIYQVF